MGGLQRQEALRKQQEAADYWGTRRAEANAAVSSALSSIGQAAGTALAYGAFDKASTGLSDTGVSTKDLMKLQMMNTVSGLRQQKPSGMTQQRVSGLQSQRLSPLSYYDMNYGD
jgi:hypothetical protein